MQSHLNLGFGADLTISDLAQLVKKVVGFQGKIVLDTSKPDGPPKKLMDSKKLRALGWTPSIDLESGLIMTYQDFLRGDYRAV